MIGSLNDQQIRNLLQSEWIGRVGCHASDRTYVVPITYAYQDHNLYGHTKEGMKVEWMRANPSVCVEVDKITNNANWQSVILWGTYEELKGRQAEDALQILVNKLHPMMTSETSLPRHGLDRPHAPIDPLIKMVVFKIKIEEATGRFERSS
ncbi:MAG: pyridoxamine 5'-phosphate oxidase family protein [Cyclobacteriaceae bacterium]